jgi:hypothetical protein
MAWLEGLETSIGTELELIVTTPEYNERAEKKFDDHHNWLWRKVKRFSPMRFRFNSPPKYPHKGKEGIILIPDMPSPNAINSLWGTVIGINYRNKEDFDHPNADDKGIGVYGLTPQSLSLMESTGIIRVKGLLTLDEFDTNPSEINVYTTVESTRASNLHYVLRDLDSFLKNEK